MATVFRRETYDGLYPCIRPIVDAKTTLEGEVTA